MKDFFEQLWQFLSTNQNDVIFAIAVIGCFTGCVSLLINLYNIFVSKGKIIIKTNKRHNLAFEKTKESRFATQYQGVIFLEIINSSPNPITIYDIAIRFRDGWYSPDICPVSEIVLEQTQEKKYLLTSRIDMTDSLQLPLLLEPFRTYKGHMFIAQYPLDAKEKECFFMKVSTTRKNKYLFGVIHKWQRNDQ